MSNLGYFGNAFSNRNAPSGEYPLSSKVEHIYRGGIWVGAKTPDGELHVSTGAQDANGLEEGDEIRWSSRTSSTPTIPRIPSRS